MRATFAAALNATGDAKLKAPCSKNLKFRQMGSLKFTMKFTRLTGGNVGYSEILHSLCHYKTLRNYVAYFGGL